MKQRKAWTKEEDEVLRLLRQTRGQKKWSAIAKKMEEQFSISGRSGKQCRQRYHNHLDSSIKTTEQTPEEQSILYQMHDDVGNRWSVISHKLPGRTDNCVKNHFYSKLRKAVRKINKIIGDHYKKEYKQIKTSLLYKIIETSESKFKVSSMVDQDVADFCSDIKNKLYYFEQNFMDNQYENMEDLKSLIQDILSFSKNDKRVKVKHRKSSGAGKSLLHPTMYLKKARSNSECSQSQFSSSRYVQSSYADESDGSEYVSVGYKSMVDLSKKQSNPSRTLPSNTNLRLTRSRSKQQTFSSNKSPQCYSDDIKSNNHQKGQFLTFTGNSFLAFKQGKRNPSFQASKSDWSQNQNEIQQILQQDNVIQQKSSGSNKFSKRSRSNSQNKSHVNLFFEDSQFEMRILSPKNLNQQKMSQQQQLFINQPMDEQIQIDNKSQDSIKTFNLGKQIGKLSLGKRIIQGEFHNNYEYMNEKPKLKYDKQKDYQEKQKESNEKVNNQYKYQIKFKMFQQQPNMGWNDSNEQKQKGFQSQ